MKKIIATIPAFSNIRGSCIFRGKAGKRLKVEFEDTSPPSAVGEKLVEVSGDGTVLYRKPGETAKTTIDLIKEGKPPKLERIGVRQK